MAECRNSGGRERDLVCIDTYRVLDSCRDKDCFENVKVYLTCTGQDIIDRTNVVRAKCAKVEWSCIDINPVPFNRGFYQLNIKIYVKITFEACVGPGNMQEFEGVAVVEKKVILFGSEGNVSVFKSEAQQNSFCACGNNKATSQSTLPIAVLETVDPIILGTSIVEPTKPYRCLCCCTVDEIPDCVCSRLSCDLADPSDSNVLLVSLGFFSIVRIERPAQYLVSAVEYCVPEKECEMPSVEDPCSLFKQMCFPTHEFCPPSVMPSACQDNPGQPEKRCGCGN